MTIKRRQLALAVVFLSAAAFCDLPADKPTVRIGVFGLFKPQAVRITTVSDQAIFAKLGRDRIVITPGEALDCKSASTVITCWKGKSAWKAEVVSVSDKNGNPTNFNISLPNKISRRFNGTLELQIRLIKRRRLLQPIVILAREDAVAAAVKAESPPDAPLEALKAQAIVTRSYFASAPRRHADFDYCDTTHCQFIREIPKRSDPAYQATQTTANLVLFYEHAVVPGLFSADCGGRTRTLTEAGWTVRGYPYFAVADEYCLRNSKRWRRDISLAEADEAKQETGRNSLGRTHGWAYVPSSNFTAREQAGRVTLEGSGSGHGVGLCQHGAAELARQGSSFRQILEHYFPNTQIGELF